jgi:hypothetical protein
MSLHVRVFVPVFALLVAACGSEPPAPQPAAPAPAPAPAPEPAPPPPPITGPLATVKTVQPPVIRIRAGKKAPLRPGDEIRADDKIETGKGARVQVALRDASTVKLGQDAALQVGGLKGTQPAGNKLLEAAFSVIKGAFRFTTSALADSGWKRDVNLRIGSTVTAGIRGTDVWGRADDTQEMICLIEGKIEAGRVGEPPAVMDQPKTYYQVPSGQPPRAVGPASGEQLTDWVAQTELDPAKPSLGEGPWAVVAETFRTSEDAALFSEELAVQGYPLEVREALVKGKTMYRVVLPGYASADDARRAMPTLESAFARKGLWVLMLKNTPEN